MFSRSIIRRGALALASACAVPAAADPEGAASPAAAAIKAGPAYARGGSGKGVTIAVLDTGIAAAHPEFSAAGKLLPGYNATGSSGVFDARGHGTHVAGLLAAGRDGRGMSGVAYDARLLPIKIFSDSGGGSSAYADAGLRYAIGRAQIANLSFGTPDRYAPGAAREAVRAGLLLVAAAGNSGAAHPEWPARFAKEAWANGQIIAVGAVDARNRLADFSNRAGDAAAWYLVAPGVDLSSTHLDGRYMARSGTSMATPVVSGAAAVLKQLWPYLRAEQIAAILFATATDLGAPGVDPVYGRGLVNLEKALQPVGMVRATSRDGTPAAMRDTLLRPSSATSRLWSLAAAGSLRMIALDEFRRGYEVDLGTIVSQPAAMSLGQVFGNLDRRIDIVDRVLDNGARLTVAHERSVRPGGAAPALAPGGPQAAAASRLAGFGLVSAFASGIELAFGAGGFAARHFGLAAMPFGGADLAIPVLANPYFALAPNAAHAALARSVGGVRVAAGVLSSGLNRLQASQYGRDAIPVRTTPLPRTELALFELSRSFDGAAVSLSITRAREAGGYLGAHAGGALGFGPRVATEAVQLAGAVLAAPRLAIAGQLAYGITPGEASAGRVITDVSDTRTNAFSLALIASDRLLAGDRFSLALSQPLRSYSGRMTLDVIAAIDDSGAEVRERRSFSMVPATREVMAEANYLLPLDGNASLAYALTLRRHPNNLADAAPEKLLAVRYFRQF
ncbi:MAG TPA: S8 family peptidase [Paucimonas sp.]|nr:S8 family peptidase [Paucimonas sp.]